MKGGVKMSMYISKNILLDNKRKLKSMSRELINKGEIQTNLINQLKIAELKNDNVCIKILIQCIQELAIDIMRLSININALKGFLSIVEDATNEEFRNELDLAKA
jgi:hypothetical protein